MSLAGLNFNIMDSGELQNVFLCFTTNVQTREINLCDFPLTVVQDNSS